MNYNKVMFYKKGVDISNDKSMFDFLANHFRYDTLNSWNGLESIANNVKVYNLQLEGNEWTALNFLRDDDYFEVNSLIEDWESDHPGFSLGFNGSSGGYLVLYSNDTNRNILPDYIADGDYDEYKEYCRDYNGSVKNNRYELRYFTKLVQEFDIFCDTLRDYVNNLSKLNFGRCVLENAVDEFNANYEEDLEFCNFKCLEVNDQGKVDISELKQMSSLLEAFEKYLDKNEYGCVIRVNDNLLWLEEV